MIMNTATLLIEEACVIKATQIKSVDKKSLTDLIGTLTDQKMDEVIDGIRLIMNV